MSTPFEGFTLRKDVRLQVRRAQIDDPAFEQALVALSRSNPLVECCRLLEARAEGSQELMLLIALDVEDEVRHLDSIAAEFQSLLKSFQRHAHRSFILSARSLNLGPEFQGQELFQRSPH